MNSIIKSSQVGIQTKIIRCLIYFSIPAILFFRHLLVYKTYSTDSLKDIDIQKYNRLQE